MSGPAPYGFRWQGGSLVPDPEEAPVRRLVYELFLEHLRVKTVARLLNERYRTRRGDRFSDTTVRRLLRDPSAAGPIVPPETWQRCQAILDSRESGELRPARKPTHPFSGRTFCRCGSGMRLRSGGATARYVCPACRARIDARTLEAAFARELDRIDLGTPGSEAPAVGGTARRRGAPTTSALWPHLAPRERVELVDALVSRIVVGSGEITIECAIDLDFSAEERAEAGQPVDDHPYSGSSGARATNGGNESSRSRPRPTQSSPSAVTPDGPARRRTAARPSAKGPPTRVEKSQEPAPSSRGELPELVTVEELARRWHLKPDTIRAWARRQQIPSRKVGRLTLFESRELVRWIQRQPRAGAGASTAGDSDGAV